MSKFQALNDYVIMAEIKATEETTDSGVIVNTGFTEAELVVADVVSVGTDSKYVNGDSTVYVMRSMCQKMPIEGVTYLVARSDNLLAVR